MSASAPLLVDKRTSRTYRYCAEPDFHAYDALYLLRGPIRKGLIICKPVSAALSWAMHRQQKITLGEMRESGPRRLLIYCGGYRCAHSVVVDAARWVMMFAYRTSSRNLLAKSAATAAPMSGRCLSGHEWERMGVEQIDWNGGPSQAPLWLGPLHIRNRPGGSSGETGTAEEQVPASSV
jgi:hypothetical protein